MAEITNMVEAGLVLDKKLDASRYDGGDLKNYIASQEITVTITLSEYRNLVAEKATKDADIQKAKSDQYERNRRIEELEKANETLKAENYELKKQADALQEENAALKARIALAGTRVKGDIYITKEGEKADGSDK